MKKNERNSKLYVTIPVELAEAIRCFVPRGKRSAFVAEALEYYLRHLKQKEALEKGFWAWKDEDHPDLMTPEDSVRYVNAFRDLGKERQEYLDKLWEQEPEK
jgi:hypothetical protein